MPDSRQPGKAPYGTKTSKIEYDRLVAEWLARGRRPLADPVEESNGITIVELIVRYKRWAEGYYRKNGAVSRRTLLKMANGSRTSFTYDAASRLLAQYDLKSDDSGFGNKVAREGVASGGPPGSRFRQRRRTLVRCSRIGLKHRCTPPSRIKSCVHKSSTMANMCELIITAAPLASAN